MNKWCFASIALFCAIGCIQTLPKDTTAEHFLKNKFPGEQVKPVVLAKVVSSRAFSRIAEGRAERYGFQLSDKRVVVISDRKADKERESFRWNLLDASGREIEDGRYVEILSFDVK